ncbi:uncharacterized protein DS421_12g353330 [Arachis hypogaea]|nr:uncharacterized protein DS421_12g353330 [Arachis hypogaea]
MRHVTRSRAAPSSVERTASPEIQDWGSGVRLPGACLLGRRGRSSGLATAGSVSSVAACWETESGPWERR